MSTAALETNKLVSSLAASIKQMNNHISTLFTLHSAQSRRLDHAGYPPPIPPHPTQPTHFHGYRYASDQPTYGPQPPVHYHAHPGHPSDAVHPEHPDVHTT